MGLSKIEWTDRTINFWVGCDIVSAGCTNCYAMKMAARIQGWGNPSYEGVTKRVNGQTVWTGRINVGSEKRWNEPLSTLLPTLFFVNSMNDFWHPNAKDEWRKRAFDIFRRTPRHQYQILTKRPEHIAPILERMGETVPGNAWLGCTVEDHRVVDRIAMLREVPARIRFLSVEPMTAPLGEVDLRGIHWVILGGESGPRARPMQLDWALEVRDQCIAQGVPLFFKQFGLAKNNPLFANGGIAYVKKHDPIGKGGSLLDGRQWHQWPFFVDNPLEVHCAKG